MTRPTRISKPREVGDGSRAHGPRRRPRWSRSPSIAIASLLALALTSVALAQNAVEVAPPVELHEARAGEAVDAVFTVKNPSSVPLLIRVSLADWHYLPDGTPNYLAAGSLPRSLRRFVTFNPAELLLEPGQSSAVRYTVDVPSDAEPGSYWGVLFMEADDPDPEPGFVLARFSVRVGHVVYVNVAPLRADGVIEGIFGEPPQGPEDSYRLHIQYANTGNAVQRLDGYVELRDASGTVLFTEHLPPLVSLPGDVVGRTFHVYGPLEPGYYTALVVYNYGDTTIDVAADHPFRLEQPLFEPAAATGSR
jgi:hypothetical protein